MCVFIKPSFHKYVFQSLREVYDRSLIAVILFQPFCSLIQIHGHNRARQRDKLGHILEDFATLQDEVFISTLVTIDRGIPLLQIS